MDKRIEIIDDVEDVVTFDTIVRDTVNRNDVAQAEERIAVLEQEIADRNAEMEALKEKIAYAKEIIAIADAKKAEAEQATEEVAENNVEAL